MDTINETVSFAKEVYEIVCSIQENDAEKRIQGLISRGQKYIDFYRAFPIVVQVMCNYGFYDEECFKVFLKRMYSQPKKGMEGVCDAQAFYVKKINMKFGRGNPSKVKKHAKEAYRQTYEMLMKEVKKIEEAEKAAKRELEEEHQKMVDEKKQEILEFLKKSKN